MTADQTTPIVSDPAELEAWAEAQGFKVLAVKVLVPLSVLTDADDFARRRTADHVAGMAAESARRAVLDHPRT